jgi:hypothetical protein
VVISSLSTYQDVQQELTAKIQGPSIWAVVVTGYGDIDRNDETGFIDKDGSYIFLIPDGGVRNFAIVFSFLLKDREIGFKNVWNYEARFVMATANEILMTQKWQILFLFLLL